MKKNTFPKGRDDEKVRRVISHYEKQTDEEALAEDEASYKDREYTMLEVPNQLIPEIRKLIYKYRTSRHHGIVADRDE
ncbi:hypothetical protein H8E88_13610 [candidate division KSB1 bacterium]|nr:hypothetical protein [candidate division KSB1 bacterium]